MPYAVTLIDIVEVDILNVAKEEDIDGGVDGGVDGVVGGDSCFLKVTHKLKGNILDSFFDINDDKYIAKFNENDPIPGNCKYFDNTNGTNVPEALYGWFKKMNESVASHRQHRIVLQMRQEPEMPKSGIQFISGIEFNDDDTSATYLLSPPPSLTVTYFEKERVQVYVGLIGIISHLLGNPLFNLFLNVTTPL